MHLRKPDNESQNGSLYRPDSSTKRTSLNRIKVVSKQVPPHEMHQRLPAEHSVILNSPLGDPVLKRMNTWDERAPKEGYEKNLLKLMQEQLEMGKQMWENKMKDNLKQYSIELSKLKIKIENCEELLAKKEMEIQALKTRRAPVSPHPHKLLELEAMLKVVLDEQARMRDKMAQIDFKVAHVEKGLLNILACKMFNLQKKIDKFAEISHHKMSKIEQELSHPQYHRNLQANKMEDLSPLETKNLSDAINSRIDSLKAEIFTFKSREFTYENFNIKVLQGRLSQLNTIVSEMEMTNFSKRAAGSKSGRKKKYDSGHKQSNASVMFDDYEEVYEELDSLGEDQFFHPLEQSSMRYKRTGQETPSRMNESFENFTSDDEDENSPTQARLIQTLLAKKCPLPLPIAIDLSGLVQVKSDGTFLVDNEQKCFKLSGLELNRLRHKGYIVW